MQVTDTLLMVRPAAFSYNDETAVNNSFQQRPSLSAEALQQKVLAQFDAMVKILRNKGIQVLVADDTPSPAKPDAIFPNNWFNTGTSGVINVFPMFASNRRNEKRDDILQYLRQRFVVKDVHDWSAFEAEAQYLEGTGSMVMDHENHIIYACLSDRTHLSLLEKFSAANGYRAMAFRAEEEPRRPVYHTNVMMSIGEGFAVLCPKIITDPMERTAVAQLLEATGHENIYIEPGHMKQFAGNLLQVKNQTGEKFIVLSQTALHALPKEKLGRLEAYGALLPVDVSLIEQVNGGSVRCMMAEIFLRPL